MPPIVWFDALTPKQLRIAKYVKQLAHSRGYDFFLTSREYDEMSAISKILSLNPVYIGRHGGSDLKRKLEASVERLVQLYHTIEKLDVRYIVCHGSPEATRIGFGLRIPTININDSPHAEAVARLTVPLTTKLVSTDFIPERVWYRFGLPRGSLVKYHGIEAVMWIRREKIEPMELGLRRPIVLFRPEETKASYMDRATTSSYLAPALRKAQKEMSFSLVVLPRYRDQRLKLQEELPDALVLGEQVEGLSLIASADVFIGAGGTMTWEAALLGKPTLAAFPKTLYVEKALKKLGLLAHVDEATLTRKLRLLLKNLDKISANQKKLAEEVLRELEDPLNPLSRIMV